MKAKHVLITGGAGYIATNLANYLSNTISQKKVNKIVGDCLQSQNLHNMIKIIDSKDVHIQDVVQNNEALSKCIIDSFFLIT